MKILHIYKTSYPMSFGGIEETIDMLARGGTKKKITVDVLAFSKNRHIIQHNGSKIYFLKQNFFIASTPFSFTCFKEFKKIVIKYDIIHFHYPFPFGDILLLYLSILRISKPIILTYHSDIVRQKFLKIIYEPIRLIFFKQVKKIIYTSQNYYNNSDILRKYKSKSLLIPIGIDIKEIRKIDKNLISYWKKKLPKKFFLFIGSARKYKGLKYLIKAAMKYDFNVVISCTEREVKRLYNDLKMSNNIFFLGSISHEDKKVIISLCDCLVLPSILRSEAYGIVLLEASALKKPLISTELGTATSLININNVTGYVVPHSNTEKLSEAMFKIFSDSKRARYFGNNAYERSKKIFDYDSMINSYIKIYTEILF